MVADAFTQMRDRIGEWQYRYDANALSSGSIRRQVFDTVFAETTMAPPTT
jgi:hypothetical protein